MPSRLTRRASLVVAAALLAIPATAQQPRPNQLPPPGPPQVQQPRPNQLPPPGPPQAQPQRPAGPQAPAAQAPPAPAPINPYKALAITMPTPVNDPSFDAFRKQLADVAQRKDRNALTRLVVTQGFFWEGENGDKADKSKPAIVNLEQAIGPFSGAEASGWDALAQAADDPTLEPLPNRAGVMCGPAGPQIDGQAFEALVKQTGTDPGDWAFPVAPNLEVRSAGQPNAPVIEKLGLHLVRVIVDPPPANAPQTPPTFIRVVTPSGRTGFVAVDGISPIGFDQLCYIKDASGWKIAGFAAAE
jgi:hypothetical protein